MDADDYQKAALRTYTVQSEREGRLMTALGLCGEAGEFAEIVKKAEFHRHNLDMAMAKKELGDVSWYLAAACHALGFTLSEVMTANIEKLKARYPHGFTSEDSRNRKDGDT